MDCLPLISFESSHKSEDWIVIDDGVMGGFSASGFFFSPRNTAIFKGNLSLENSGGFASALSPSHDYRLENCQGLLLQIKGDGKSYQLRLKTEGNFDGIAYKAGFMTSFDQWLTIRLPFRMFAPTLRGKPVPSAPPLEPGRIRQVGFLIADKQVGPFQLEIDWIKAFRGKDTEVKP